MKKMILYHPIEFKGVAEKQSGSYLRPMQMKQGFESLGYDVIYITGSIKSRTWKVKEILASGEYKKIKFCYIESANIPLALSNAEHWPIDFYRDRNNLRILSRYMKIGIFYRDIYWKYASYSSTTGLFKGIFLKSIFLSEYKFFKKTLDYIFVPSKEFIKMCPNVKGKAEYQALPPGCKADSKDIFNNNPTPVLSVFYSGNIAYGTEYSIIEMMEYVTESKYVGSLTINTSIKAYDESYKKYLKDYPDILSNKIKFTFDPYEKNHNTEKKYDIALMRLSKADSFYYAMPLKIFDYLGMGLPIIAYRDTAVGRLIDKNDLGWTIASKDDFFSLTERLCSNRHEIREKHDSIIKFRLTNTWEKRCKDVEKALL